MEDLLDKLKSISWLRIVKSLPFQGGASSTKWVYLSCAFVVCFCLVMMTGSACWFYIHTGKIDIAFASLIGTTITVVVSIAANAQNKRRELAVTDGGTTKTE